MALETATYINTLDASNPASSDGVKQGDDHLRMLKAVLKATFPKITAAVSASAAELNKLDGVTVSTTELNRLSGVTSDIQDQINGKLASSSYNANDILTKLKTKDGSGSGLDADKLDGRHASEFIKLGGYTDGHVWLRRNSSHPAAYFTNNGGGHIMELWSGTGGSGIGSRQARFTSDGAFQKTVANTSIVKNHNGKDALKFVSSRGALQIGADDTVIIGSGEAAPLITRSVDQESEDVYLGSDRHVYLLSNLQDGWGSRKTLLFNSSGHLSINGGVVDHSGRGIGGVGTYAMLLMDDGYSATPNSTHSGSKLRYAGADGHTSGSRPSGTWRCMGFSRDDSDDKERTTLWKRIS